MIKNSQFYIENIRSVVFIGWCPNIDALIKINVLLKLESLIITSANQKKLFNKNLKVNVFKDIEDSKFTKFIKDNCDIKILYFYLLVQCLYSRKKVLIFLKVTL